MPLIELDKPELPYETNEELKLFRTNLQFCGDDKQVILITSAFSGEGKSTITLDLCDSLADLNKRVLMIDADMRKSVLRRKVIGPVPKKGLSHYLSGQCELNEVIYKTATPNLSIAFSGVVPPNPTELLSAKRFDDMIEIARKHYDYVIIDCPPVGMVVDASVVSRCCDGSIIIIEAGEVRYRLAQEVVAKMRNTPCPILGVVLNKVDRKKHGKYYGKYYGRYGKKYYGYYYRHEDE